MLYIDRLKIIKSMIMAKEDDDPLLYVGGYNIGGVKLGNMNYGGMNFGGIPLDVGDEHEFERKEISEFILEEIENLKKGQNMSIEEKRENLQNAKRNKEKSKLELTETPKYRLINGKNQYKRKDIKKYINYAIYRIEQQERAIVNEDELEQNSFLQKLRVTSGKINNGHYGESAKRVIQDWSLTQ